MLLPETVRIQTFQRNGTTISVLRLDEIHPYTGGNKLYKLKYNLQEARQQGHDTLLTFGGAFSNHIAATAAAGKASGFKTIGIIRGEKESATNTTLRYAAAQGMTLHFMDRESYRRKETAEILTELENRFGRFFLIPEGGANENGMKGCMEIPKLLSENYSVICVACGTGTTIAGIAAGALPGVSVIGFPVLKNGLFLEPAIKQMLDNSGYKGNKNWALQCDYHFGGYARISPELSAFMQHVAHIYGIPLDYVYTAKVFFGVFDLLDKSFFKPGARILIVHTGGLQGNAGFDNKHLPVENRPVTQ